MAGYGLLHSIKEMEPQEARSIAGMLPPYEEGRHNPVRRAFFERLVFMQENGSNGPQGLEDSMEAILEAKGPDRFTYAVRLLGFTEPTKSQGLYSMLLDKMEEEKLRDEAYGEYAVMGE